MTFPTVKELYDLSHTAASPLLSGVRYAWEALPLLSDFITEYMKTLSTDEYEEKTSGVYIHKEARVAESALVLPPTVIGKGTEVRHGAYIRGNALIGEGCVIGNSTEIKNAILFDGAEAPHYNYIGDSILGYKAHMGAGSIASNFRSDKKTVRVHIGAETVETGLRKFGTLLGDYAEIGCSAVLCPGSVVGKRSIVYPLCRVRGVIREDSIYKEEGNIVKRV